MEQHTDRLVEIVKNLRIVVDRMKKKPARSETHVVEEEEEEEGWRTRVEQRLSAQEDSIQHLTYNVASLVNLLSNFFQVAHHQQEEVQTRTGASVDNHQLTLSRSSLADQVVHTSLPSQEKEEQAKKKQSVESNKGVTLQEETINADAQQQLSKVSQALAVLASASSINLDHSMMDKEGTDGEQDIMKAYEAAHEEIDDSTDGACSALTNRYYEGKVTSEELASATASTTGVHLEKTPTGPTLSSSSVPSGKGSSMVLTLENKSNDQPTVSSSILSSVPNSDMSLVGDYYNKYNYGDLSPEEEWRSGELKKIAEDLDDFLGKVKTGGSVANDETLGFTRLLNDELTLDNISRATLSSLPDEVVGVTSLPSEDSVSERPEELIKAKNLKKPVVLKNAPSPSLSSRASASTKTKQSRREAVDPHDKILKVVARCEKSTEKCMKLFDQHNRAHD